jgi:hypothetical protein
LPVGGLSALRTRLLTVCETSVFMRDAERLLGADEGERLILYLAANPEAGDVIPDTGGVRKLRWRSSGRGKRGGARVIYYHLDARAPLYLIALYAKNRKVDLTGEEKKALKRFVAAVKAAQRT